MAAHQLEAFVTMFRQLWSEGLSAHLDIDCHAGQAWCGLRVQLGHPRAGDAPRHDRRQRKHHREDGPSYLRLHERRAAQREAGQPVLVDAEHARVHHKHPVDAVEVPTNDGNAAESMLYKPRMMRP